MTPSGEGSASHELTREAVDAAIAEYRSIGGPAFRKKYKFGGARDYFLVVEGETSTARRSSAPPMAISLVVRR